MKIGTTLKMISSVFFAAVLFFNGLGVFSLSDAAAASWLSGWANRVPLTIDHTKVTGSLINFPVMVRLSASSGVNAADVTPVFATLGIDANRKKIAVTAADGVTQLNVEIVKWDSAGRQGNMWVKVPSISSTIDTVLYLYYDANQIDNTSYVGDTGSNPAQNVWDSNFMAVWHLAQSGTGTAGEFKDSTSRRHDGKAGSASAAPVRIQFSTGYAQRFDGSNDYITIPDSNDFSINTPGSITISAWMSVAAINQPTSTGGYTRWLGKSVSGAHEWQFEYYDQSHTRSQWITYYNYSLSGGLGAGADSRTAFPAN